MTVVLRIKDVMRAAMVGILDTLKCELYSSL